MADIIKRPAVGPTKSTNKAGDKLDSAVPDPGFLCIPGSYEYFLTSKPYPVYARDNVTEEHDITFIGLAGWDPEYMTTSYEWVDATLTHKISYSAFSQGIEYMTTSYEWVDATLTQIIDYLEFDGGIENMTTSYEWVDATLTTVIGYIFIDQPPDNIVEDHIITGITLTP